MIGIRIKELRLRNGISRELLASSTGLTIENLHHIEDNKIGYIETSTLLKIVETLRLKNSCDFVNLMRLNKVPKRIHVYCVGLPKTGTVSLVGLFGNYRSRHEFHQWETHQMIIRYKKGDISRSQFYRFLKERDLLGGFLEVDSSHFNRHYVDILAEEFSNTKFICLIRDCYSWVNSFVNYFTVPEREAIQSKELNNGIPFDIPRGDRKAKAELVDNFHKYIDTPLAFWSSSYNEMLVKLPPERSLIVRTHELSRKIDEIADFVGVSPDTLVKKRSHLNKAEYTVNILHRFDRDFLEKKFRQHCAGLMGKFFRGYGLDDFLNGNPVV